LTRARSIFNEQKEIASRAGLALDSAASLGMTEKEDAGRAG
jgi:hypothetical protein